MKRHASQPNPLVYTQIMEKIIKRTDLFLKKATFGFNQFDPSIPARDYQLN